MESLIIRPDDIKRILEICGRDEVMRLMIQKLRECLASLGKGRIENSPARSGFTKYGDSPGVVEFMPHYSPGSGITMKSVAYSPRNSELSGLPTVLGYVCRIDEDTGVPLVIADGVVLTAMRTGAASAIATGLLSPSEAHVVGIVGAGAQSVVQLHALSMVREIHKVLVLDIDPARAASLSKRASFLDVEFEEVVPERMLTESDVICTTTSVGLGNGPVLPDAAHKPHLHINSVGADEVGKTELPVSLLKRAAICVDHVEQALREGECQQIEPDEIWTSLGYLCAHPEEAESRRFELTVFDSTGFALEDHAALDVFLELSRSIGLGEKIPIIHHPSDPFDPYSMD
ncbi:ornithine cyclodeaminase family protein [Nocardia asiatica]|uniref:ornithine cyclodeaminase family protein n=1 Tax=Nocardia asiatica TaxID=209252 RepID=UPI002458E261|nr:ornithine cyclodeaminase family protein [Nocardia asiatica]